MKYGNVGNQSKQQSNSQGQASEETDMTLEAGTAPRSFLINITTGSERKREAEGPGAVEKNGEKAQHKAPVPAFQNN
jgi:hypothetical protein